MTIAVAYLTSEGIVLGADSTSTIFKLPETAVTGVEGSDSGKKEEPVCLQIFNHAQKLFEIGERDKSRLGLCTYGDGMVGPTSHRSIIARLSDQVTPRTTVSEAADLLFHLVSDEQRTHGFKVGDLGYFIGGWNPDLHDPACVRLTISKGLPTFVNIGIGEVVFGGATRLFERYTRGYDPDLLSLFAAHLKANMGSPQPEVMKAVISALSRALAELGTGGHQDLPLREAIDFVHNCLHLTVKGYKFRTGIPICGGPIEVGFISVDRHFRWVNHKSFDTAILESEGGAR